MHIALEKLRQRWREMSKKAQNTSHKGGMGIRPAAYFDGVAAGLERALADVNALLEHAASSPVDASPPADAVVYLDVDRDYARHILDKAGMSYKQVYEDAAGVHRNAHRPAGGSGEQPHRAGTRRALGDARTLY